MGNQSVNKFSDPEAKKRFTRMLINDINALEQMLENGQIESGITRIGAEQELCLVDNEFLPKSNNLEILDAIDDPHFVPEIATFNIEANLDPQDFESDCFKRMEKQLRELMAKAHKVTQDKDTKIVMTGILPTLRKEHLQFDHITPNPRYRALDDVIKGQRGSDFELNILGVDELITNHNNILFEACNTSFQIHMQISPEEFTAKYNWSQMIAGPVMAIAANSPLLLGKRLWKETRIALFQQSVDTRTSTNIKREQEPRVTFGRQWLEGTVVDLYKDNISRFNIFFAGDEDEDSLETLNQGKIPELEALKMHNSTVYKWNRPCFGVGGGKPHLRIENRYIPSGPTVKDEIANAAFWLGVMHGMPQEYENLPQMVHFEDCRYNFYNACRNGLDTKFKWFGKTVSADKLIRNILLPIAEDGLNKAGIDKDSIDELLGVVRSRLKRNTSGASWILDNFNTLRKDSTANEASKNITAAIYHNQMTSKPVHLWKNVDLEASVAQRKFATAKDIMETELYIAKEDDIVELAVNMMDWKNIRSIPVENHKNELVGLITAREILRYHTMKEKPEILRDIMSTRFLSITPDMETSELIEKMAETRADCALVVENQFLLGLVSDSDIVQVAKWTGIFKK
ncbi:MAG: CBS domain-containing protein [Bacteroidia bacterium]